MVKSVQSILNKVTKDNKAEEAGEPKLSSKANLKEEKGETMKKKTVKKAVKKAVKKVVKKKVVKAAGY